MQKRFAVLGAMVCALSLFVSDRAEATYNYSTSISLSGATNGAVVNPGGLSATLGGTTITFANQAGAKDVPSINTLNLGDVTVSSSGAPVTFSVNFTDVTTVTNNAPPGSPGTLTFTGTINLSNAGPGSGTVLASNLLVTVPNTTSGGASFNMSAPSFSSPTINGAGGNVSALITAGAIPEPASIVLFGLGMGAMGVVGLRRRFQSA